MKSFRSWLLDWLRYGERRRAKRHPTPTLAVHYWNGGRPNAHTVRDISSTGLFLVTDERWYPRTLVRVTLQRTDGADDDTQRSITVESMVVRWGTDGVGLKILAPESPDSNGRHTRLANGADKKAWERFSKQISSNKVKAIVEGVLLAH